MWVSSPISLPTSQIIGILAEAIERRGHEGVLQFHQFGVLCVVEPVVAIGVADTPGQGGQSVDVVVRVERMFVPPQLTAGGPLAIALAPDLDQREDAPLFAVAEVPLGPGPVRWIELGQVEPRPAVVRVARPRPLPGANPVVAERKQRRPIAVAAPSNRMPIVLGQVVQPRRYHQP